MKKKSSDRKPSFPMLTSIVTSLVSAIVYDHVKSPNLVNIYEYFFLWIISILVFIMVILEIAYYFDRDDEE